MLCFTGLPRRSVSRVFATLLCLTPYRLAFAETTYALPDITVMAAPHSGNIVSTATLLPAAPLDLPFSATRLMVEALGDRHPTDIADLADYSPGISRSSNYWGMDTPTFHLRGFNAGESTAYYRDGFRYQARGPVPMANVEALEILRGPVSALYGWSDPGGAVQIITKKPVPYPLRQFSAEVNQWGKARLVADMGGPLNDAWQYRLVAAAENGTTFRNQSWGQQYLLAPSFLWHGAGERRLELSAEFMDDRRATDYGIPAYQGKPADVPVERAYTEPWGQQHTQSLRLAGRWSQPAYGGQLSLAASVYSLDYLNYTDAEPYSVSGTQVLRWYEKYPEQYYWTSFYADWQRAFTVGETNHRLALRAEYARERRSMENGEWDDYPAIDIFNPVYGAVYTPTAGFTRYNQAWRNRSLGLVAQDEIRTGRWIFLAGVRGDRLLQKFDYYENPPAPFDWHENSSDTAVVPRLGAVFKATEQLSLYGNISSGHASVLPQSRAFDGSQFKPVTSRQAEVGLKVQSDNKRWLLTAAYFDIRRDNVLTRDPDHPTFSIQTGEQASRGVEMELSGEVARNWRLTGQTTWMDACLVKDNRYTPGNGLPYAPNRGTSLWLTHFLPGAGGTWRLSGGLVHEGARFADFANTTQLPAYVRADVALGYGTRHWDVSATIENLTDVRYYASGVENRPAVIYPGAPRTVGIRIKHDI